MIPQIAPPFRLRSKAGFTLMELIATIGIVAILVVLSVTAYGPYVAKAEAVKCANNLHSLQIAFAAYVQDEGQWPPTPLFPGRPDWAEQYWLKFMIPYGIGPKNWQCPTMQRLIAAHSPDQEPKVDYIPTMFDNKPQTPYRWAGQPWLIEIGNMHGHGALMVFRDGSVRSLDDVLGKKN